MERHGIIGHMPTFNKKGGPWQPKIMKHDGEQPENHNPSLDSSPPPKPEKKPDQDRLK